MALRVPERGHNDGGCPGLAMEGRGGEEEIPLRRTASEAREVLENSRFQRVVMEQCMRRAVGCVFRIAEYDIMRR